MKAIVEDYKYSCKGEEMQLKDIQIFVKKYSHKNWKKGNNQRRKVIAKLNKGTKLQFKRIYSVCLKLIK